MAAMTMVWSKWFIGVRVQLLLGLGMLCLILLLVTGLAWHSLTSIRSATQATVEVQERLSRLSSTVAVQTLLCRLHEKQFLLELDAGTASMTSRAEWDKAYTALGNAIKTFDEVAVSVEDKQQAATWYRWWEQYGQAFELLGKAIDKQAVASSQEAATLMTPFNTIITPLTETSVEVAQNKSSTAEQSVVALEQRQNDIARTFFFIAAVSLVGTILWCTWFPQQLTRPLALLTSAAERLGSGALHARVNMDRHDELGQLAQSFNHMAQTIEQRTRELEAQYQRVDAARVEAELSQSELREKVAMISAQRATIQAMSTPILPIASNSLLMPLVGELDAERLEQAQTQVLRSLEASSVRYLILDITGVPVVDTQVAAMLVQLTKAARLLGASTILSGIHPEVAQTIVGLGITFENIEVHSTLESSIARVLTQRARRT
jgi:rsbT co-antagonist protein RsbR